MNYMSVCSGVEAASLAWKGLGWEPLAFSEIEKFPCAVLAERFPGVPNLGDMTKIEVTDDGIHGAGFTVFRRDIDLLVGGTPCQSFSVAGRREGLKGASGLAFHFVRLLREIQPKWFVWENVPGALSSRTDGQLDFNFLVGAFAECGYGLAWRILDAQYVRSKSFPFAIPQRRRRLFVVGCLGDGARAGKVLFDGESLSGDTPPRRIKMQWTSGCAEGGADVANEKKVTCYENHAQPSRVVEGEISPTLNCMGGGSGMLPIVLEERKQGIQAIRRMPKTSDSQRMPDKGRLQCVVDMRQLEADTDGNVSPTLVYTDYKVGKAVEDTLNQDIIAYDNHSQDCRVKETGDVSPTLSCMSNVNRTLVQDVGQTVSSKTGRPTEAGGCPNFKETGVANTLNLWDLGESRANELVVGYPPVISLDGDKIGNSNDLMHTHTAKGVHGVAYGINCQASLMHPFSEEVSQVISVAHKSGVVREECVPIDMMDAARDADKKDDVNRQVLGVGWRGTVRRLLPVETERLMGFPDNWTQIPWRGKPAEQCPDGPRYKACGNSFCVNCVEWIGERIEMVEREPQEEGR